MPTVQVAKGLRKIASQGPPKRSYLIMKKNCVLKIIKTFLKNI